MYYMNHDNANNANRSPCLSIFSIFWIEQKFETSLCSQAYTSSVSNSSDLQVECHAALLGAAMGGTGLFTEC